MYKPPPENAIDLTLELEAIRLTDYDGQDYSNAIGIYRLPIRYADWQKKLDWK